MTGWEWGSTWICANDWNKYYIHNAESVLENNEDRILYDFEVQSGCLSQSKRIDLIIVKKEKDIYPIMDFLDSGNDWIKE